MNGRWRRMIGAGGYGAAVLAGLALVAAGEFSDLRGAGAGPVPGVLAVVLGALLVARLSSYFRAAETDGRRGDAGGERESARAADLRLRLRRDLEAGGLLLVCAYAAFEATGGPRSMAHPLVYALVAFLVTFHRRAVSLPLVALALALEVALFWGSRTTPGARFLDVERELLASHAGFIVVFAGLHAVFLQAEVARRRRHGAAALAAEIARRRAEALGFRLIASQLPAESRTRSREEEEEIIAAASVETIHQALFYNLELLKKSLDAHTCVLLWLDDGGRALRIKELVSDADALVAGDIPIDAGVLGAVVKDRLPVHLRDPKPGHLAYYIDGQAGGQPIGAFLGVPVLEETGPAALDEPSGVGDEDGGVAQAPLALHGAAAAARSGRARPSRDATQAGPSVTASAPVGHLRGVLCVDRLARANETETRPSTSSGRTDVGGDIDVDFDERDEQLLQGAARQILRAIQSERVFVAVERGKYEHERFARASDLLNRALTPAEVAATAFRAARELADFDVAALTRYDKAAQRHRVLAAVGEGAEELDALSFAHNAGLVSMVVKNRHYLPAAGERRDKEATVFTKRIKLRGMESLLVLPLVVADEPIGTFTFAARARARFGKDKRELLSVIANQVAVSLKNAEMYEAMEEMATTDGLTGLVNHRSFQERYADLLDRAERQGQPVSLLLTDIDHFKKIDDAHGHPIGDVVLKGVAGVCKGEVRKVDVAARYGGEEFAIVLDGTDREGAKVIAERIRKEVAAQEFSSDKADGGRFACTLSLGIAAYPDDGRDPKTLIAHADQALYSAKHGGRNRVVAWADLAGKQLPLRVAG